MATEGTLCDKVTERLGTFPSNQEQFLSDPAMQNALRLADMYEDIKPVEYILPLDAMAGFPVQAKAKNL